MRHQKARHQKWQPETTAGITLPWLFTEHKHTKAYLKRRARSRDKRRRREDRTFYEWLTVSVANIYSKGQEADHLGNAGFAFAARPIANCSMRTMPKLRGLIFAATAIVVSPVYAETCPGPITKASRLVLVTTRSMTQRSQRCSFHASS